MTLEIRPLDPAEATFAVDRMSKTSIFDTPRFFLDLYGLLPGQEQRPHLHDGNDKVYVCLEGEVTVTVGDQGGMVRKGEAVLARAGERHGVRNDGPHRAVLLVFMAPNPGAS